MEWKNRMSEDIFMRDALESCLKVITKENDQDLSENCIETLLYIISNILHHPNDQKYQQISSTSNAFQNTIANTKGGMDFLNAVGFRRKMIDSKEFIVLINKENLQMAKDLLIPLRRPVITEENQEMEMSGSCEFSLDLWNAVLAGNISKVQKIIKQPNVSHFIDGKDPMYGATPLFIASQQRHLDIVKLLISSNAKVNDAMNDGTTPLYIACQQGNLDVVKLLISSNANVNVPTDTGATPLCIASQNGYTDIVKLLLSSNANVDAPMSDGITPLCIASLQGHKDIIKLLVSSNANVNTPMNDGTTPLIIASQEGYIDIVKLLISSNANVNSSMNDGTTPLYIASQEGHIDIVKLLISSSANVNAQTNDGRTSLHAACQEGHLQVVSILLQNNADVTLKWFGRTAMDEAMVNNHSDVVKLLEKETQNKKMNRTNNGNLVQQ